MTTTRILITGGTGCIGATTVHQLLRAPVDKIIIGSRTSDTRLLEIWQGQLLDPRVTLVKADIASDEGIRKLLSNNEPTHILHLGALQSPDCESSPLRGMEVNVGGTLSLLRAVRELDLPLRRFVFASSAAVYGKRSMYPSNTVAESAPLAPPNLYGVWKVAGEQLAALFHEATGIPTVCLRLNTTYGPGRDQGKTSAPTVALKSIVLGNYQRQLIPFEMPYGGRENYHYVEDVGAHFATVTIEPFDGFGAFNIKGRTIEIAEFLQSATHIADEMGLGDFCHLSVRSDAPPNLFVCDLDDTLIDLHFPGLPTTDICDGIRHSFTIFHKLAQQHRLTV